MSNLFQPLSDLPGWEATDGRFALCPCGRLRFARAIRRCGDTLAYGLIDDTPRSLERRILGFAADLARAAERVA